MTRQRPPLPPDSAQATHRKRRVPLPVSWPDSLAASLPSAAPFCIPPETDKLHLLTHLTDDKTSDT